MQELKGVSLEEYLRRSNPKLTSVHHSNLNVERNPDIKIAALEKKATEKTKHKQASSKNFNWELPMERQPWPDFSLDAFDAVYKKSLEEVLNLKGNWSDFSQLPEYPFCEIWDEDSLDGLLIRYVQPTVSEALVTAQASLPGRQSKEDIFVSTMRAESTSNR